MVTCQQDLAVITLSLTSVTPPWWCNSNVNVKVKFARAYLKLLLGIPGTWTYVVIVRHLTHGERTWNAGHKITQAYEMELDMATNEAFREEEEVRTRKAMKSSFAHLCCLFSGPLSICSHCLYSSFCLYSGPRRRSLRIFHLHRHSMYLSTNPP